MLQTTSRGFDFQHRAPSALLIPHVADQLYGREREIAILIYEAGWASAVEVQERLSAPLSNAAVRSMLNRLVAKGVLKRQPFGARRMFRYMPGVTAVDLQARALKQCADDFFRGSMEDALAALIDLMSDRAAEPLTKAA